MKQKINVYYYLTLSIVAGFFIIIISLYGSSDKNLLDIYDKIFVVLFFIIICFFGISLALFPRWYKRFKTNKNVKSNKSQNNKIIRNRLGHHPDCDQFEQHILKIKNKKVCTGCTGIALGSIISIILICIYLFSQVNYSVFYYLFLIFGLIFVFQIYLEIMVIIRNRIIHMLSNVLHVIGFFLITISIFELTSSIIYTSISILLSFLFLDTRIQISLYKHCLICKKCKEECKMY